MIVINYLILVNKRNKMLIPREQLNLVSVKTSKKINKSIFLEERTYKKALQFLNDANKVFETKFIIDSGYRSSEYQKQLFLKEMSIKKSIAEVNKTLALPSFSEHQTGLAFDVGFIKNGLYDPFYDIAEYNKEFKWLSENAKNYGFILRYPLGKEHITGYNYEPWHFRYVGNIAKYLTDKNKTLEEFLNCDTLI